MLISKNDVVKPSNHPPQNPTMKTTIQPPAASIDPSSILAPHEPSLVARPWKPTTPGVLVLVPGPVAVVLVPVLAPLPAAVVLGPKPARITPPRPSLVVLRIGIVEPATMRPDGPSDTGVPWIVIALPPSLSVVPPTSTAVGWMANVSEPMTMVLAGKGRA